MRSIYFIGADNIGYTANTEQITYIIKYEKAHALLKLSCGTELVAPFPVEELLKIIEANKQTDGGINEPRH